MADLRREFTLPPEDVAFLEEMGWPWEAIRDGNTMWLVIHEYAIPGGYQTNSTSVALQLAATYPEAQIDMAYFHPALSRIDGAAIRQLTDHRLDGKVWQRWSRHRTAQNPWLPGTDGLDTHMLLVGEWLVRELRVAA
ncbi:E2/UBC family protein [Engelhardtia mirabilis]|uniref:E2/UBC family protein n=1 Tax=Engelhardtia mirabilis TaxID=2528011 RepID=UPI003AF3F59D